MTDHTPFRLGVRAAVQVVVDDIAALVGRRQAAQASETTTAVIVGIARRVAALPMPRTEADAPIDRGSIFLDLAQVPPETIVRAAAALRDAEFDIIEMQISDNPQLELLLRQQAPPTWDVLSEEQRQHYIYRAQRMITAMVLP